ncbi:hypothetical protein V493_01735 [Pseudogymnoascus sp. VKM F-4281 (FW-2241)]|nr:hypothetical protein V493_01735 [Pseudogymnoascus sp. VKM F-4281 (FW-2241)]
MDTATVGPMLRTSGLDSPGHEYQSVLTPLQSEAYYSFKLSRPLVGREQLDISRESGSDECASFLHSYWPRNSPEKQSLPAPSARKKTEIYISNGFYCYAPAEYLQSEVPDHQIKPQISVWFTVMQLNVLYLVIVSTGVAISSAVNPRATNSWLNATNLTATNASSDTNSALDMTVWTKPNFEPPGPGPRDQPLRHAPVVGTNALHESYGSSYSYMGGLDSLHKRRKCFREADESEQETFHGSLQDAQVTTRSMTSRRTAG